MKKQLLLLLSIVLFSAITFAQNTRRADKFFNSRAYSKAAQLYEKKKDRSPSLLKNLADSYYYNSSNLSAVKTYRELFKNFGDSIELDYYFRYGHALKGVKNYEQSDKILSVYYNKPINSFETFKEIDATTPHVFEVKPLLNRGGHGDFGMSFYGEDKVSFTSARKKVGSSYSWNDMPYLDLYTATIVDDTIIRNIRPLPDVINSKTHESNAIFTRDGKTMYFNRTNRKRTKVGNVKVANIKIYKAEYIDSVWTNVQALPFTSDLYSTVHPALSKDEKTLYFSSDMPDSYGSYDIYTVEIKDDGTYGEPQNIGPIINTKHREQFPFISDYNVLYFSSVGHGGFGGLDVFRSNMVNGVFDKPVNLGSSINSNMDDYAYVIREKTDKGYVSSNRTGFDKLYGFARKVNPLTIYQVEGIVQDLNSQEILAGSLVTLFDESNTVIQDSIVGDKAYYKFEIEPNKKYKIRGTRKGYIPQEVEFSTDSKGKVQHNIYLTLESFVDAEARIKDTEKGLRQIELEKIYFDYDKSNIRKDAAAVLDILVGIMKKYPFLEIEISAHTDVRGSSNYNLQLSKKRAASTLEYLVSQGIERDRLRSIGYGELQPLNGCVKINMCTEEEYELNRRCEFTILD